MVFFPFSFAHQKETLFSLFSFHFALQSVVVMLTLSFLCKNKCTQKIQKRMNDRFSHGTEAQVINTERLHFTKGRIACFSETNEIIRTHTVNPYIYLLCTRPRALTAREKTRIICLVIFALQQNSEHYFWMKEKNNEYFVVQRVN